MTRISFIPDCIKPGLRFFCPICKEDLRVTYIIDQLLVCLKCDIAWELQMRKSRYSIESIKKDGWLKDVA